MSIRLICASTLLACTAFAAGPARTARSRLEPMEPVLTSPVAMRAAAFVAARAVELKARASTDGVSWSQWVAVPFENAGDGKWSGLVYFGASHRYLETAGARDGVEVIAIDPGDSADPKPRGRSTGTGPAVVSREQWGCTPQTCPVKDAPSYTTITHLIVHHTAGANASSDWPAVVRSIWVLHVEGNGWNDIGYNFLIDPTGVIFEGRAGGDGVLGAHFSGVNSGTLGVAVLGTYTSVPAPVAAVSSLGALLAWKAERWGVDPAGRSLHAASGLVLEHISGHRDAGLSPRATSTTECPGNDLYVLLPSLRTQVRRLLDGACPVTLAASRRCIPPEGATIDIGVSTAAGCTLAIASQADWILPDDGAGAGKWKVAANAGARRTGTVTVGGRRVEVVQAEPGAWPMPCVAPGGIVSAAGGDDRPVVAGSLVTIYGEGLGAGAAEAGSFPLPASLARASLTVNGRQAPLVYAGPGQVNAQLPASVNTGTAQAIVTVNGIAGPATNFSVTEAVPVLFAVDGRALAVNFDDSALNGPRSPARAGSIVTVWLTGAGPVQGGLPASGAANPSEIRRSNLASTASVGARPATILFLGLAPGMAGVYQCNLRLPADLESGEYPILLTVSGVSSPPVRISLDGPR